ncbi:unnamed protein product, partial [Boreogadus saida]
MSQALRLTEMATEKQTTRSTGGLSYCIATGCSNELYRAKAAERLLASERCHSDRFEWRSCLCKGVFKCWTAEAGDTERQA